jgi:hypothetical protein
VGIEGEDEEHSEEHEEGFHDTKHTTHPIHIDLLSTA